MKVVAYARVSDDKLNADGARDQDVHRQLDHLQPYLDGFVESEQAAGREWEIGEPFIDDGISAFKEDYNSRPAFVRLLNEIRARRVQRVYVEGLDRWARLVVDGLTTLKEVHEAGCTVVSIAEGEIDFTSPQGWFRSLMALGFAEWASREKSWRVTQAMDRIRNDKRRICKSCGVIHLGRHPKTCRCLICRRSTKLLPRADSARI